MPGIVGLVTKMPREWARRQLTEMVKSIRHESFYTTGILEEESLGVYVGWAARQGSFSDGMPLRNEKNDVAMVFSGEEFPTPETARRLKEQGHVLLGDPSSYLVHLYEQDRSFPSDLNGRFHGLVIDERLGSSLLFNDRYGMHRIYYHKSPDAFYFAAEAKAILAVRPELRTVDPKGLAEFVACGCVLENRTLFRDVNVLPAGSAWVIRNRAVERESKYFDPKDWENQTPLEAETYYQELREVFSRNLTRYFGGVERLGMSLTGGLDSRIILAWKKLLPQTLPFYSFGGMFRDSQDVMVSRRLAKACGQTHEVITVQGEFLSKFSRYAERSVYVTDGCVGVNHSADLYVNERAREIAPVRMTGNYGSEVLRCVRALKATVPSPGLFAQDSIPQNGKLGFPGLAQGHSLSFALFRQAPWHHYGLLSLEQTQLSVRSPFLDNDFVRTLYRAPRGGDETKDVTPRLIADGNAALAQIRSDRGPIVRGGLWNEVVRGLVEVTVKAEYAYDYGMPQWLARTDHLLSPFHLERMFLGRHKFCHFRVWYRDHLADYIQGMLLDSRSFSRPYLSGKTLETMVQAHVAGQRNHTLEIHKALTLELIHRLFVDPQ